MGTKPRKIGTRLAQAALSLFCADAALLAGRSVESVAQRCRPGDTIALPASATAAIGQLCDFSKPVAVAGGYALCVMTAPRGVR